MQMKPPHPGYGDARSIVYLIRHQESCMNALGYGDADSPLTEKGKADSIQMDHLIKRIGGKNGKDLDAIILGTLSRHCQTLHRLVTAVSIPRIKDTNLNAIGSGGLFEEPDQRKIEERYNLSRFQADGNGLYHAEDENGRFSFDPRKEQIFPFGIYCRAIVDRRLRKLVFGANDPFTSFKEIEQRTETLHDNLINIIQLIDPSTRSRILCIGSCSSLAFLVEYTLFKTIGENIAQPLTGGPPYDPTRISRYGESGFYPQKHDEISIMYLPTYRPGFRGPRELCLTQLGRPINDYLGDKDDKRNGL